MITFTEKKALFSNKNADKNKKGEEKNEKADKKVKPKKINADEFLKSMQMRQKESNEKKVNELKNKDNNTIKNSNVKNALEQAKKKEEEIKQKKIQAEKEQKELEEKRKITMQKISEKQKAQKLKEEEMKMQMELEKKEKEEEKKLKEKNFREQNDRARALFQIKISQSSWRDKAKEILSSLSSSLHSSSIGKISEEQDTTIFLDLTTQTLQYIISGHGDSILKEEFPNCISYFVQYDRYNCQFLNKNYNRSLQGDILYPVNKGKIENWELIEYLVNYVFLDKIKFNFIEECSIIFTEPINCKKEDREKIAQIFFESFNIKKLFIIKPSILTLLNEGKCTGIVAELNDDISNFTPIFDCFSLSHATITSDLGREDIIGYIDTLLRDKYPELSTSYKSKKCDIENIVNKLCNLDLDNENYSYYYDDYDYTMPDGKKIYLKEFKDKCPEILFNPKIYFASSNKQSITQNLISSINKCDKDIKKDLYGNIALTGVNSKIKGLKDRLKKEICSSVSNSYEYNIDISCNENGIQKGVEDFLSNPIFKEMWLTKEDYENEGASAVHNRFF